MSQLDDLFRSVDETVYEIAKTRPRHFDHAVVALTEGGAPVLMKLAYRSTQEKLAQFELARHILAKEGAYAYATVAEAWLAPARGTGVAPRDRPDRLEILYVLATDGTRTIGKAYLIERGEDRRVSGLSEWRMKEPLAGRLGDLLKSAPPDAPRVFEVGPSRRKAD